MTARLSGIVACLALVMVGAQAPSRVFVVVFDENSGGARSSTAHSAGAGHRKTAKRS
jgi:hypothetical protein